MKYLVLGLLISFTAHADYQSARLNQNICEEISGQRDRLIPRNEWFCGAVDGQAYARNVGVRDFYHGVGHWTQVRSEIQWENAAAINFRSIFYSATSSAGYASSSADYHLASFRYSHPESFLGAYFFLRIGDLDRQSIGRGLFVEARESIGGLMVAEWEKVQLRILHESTGFLIQDDDITNPEVSFWNGRFGIGTAWFYKQPDFQDRRKPYFYSYLSLPIENWEVTSEVGSRNNVFAYMGRISLEALLGPLNISSGIQGRYYQDGFAQGFERGIEHGYVSYDQYDKYYTNSINVFARGDHVTVASLILNFRYTWSHMHRMAMFNEVGQFDYKSVEDDRFYFGRIEYDLYPFPLREDFFSFFVTNKLMRETYVAAPPFFESSRSVPLFRTYIYAGIEGNFRF